MNNLSPVPRLLPQIIRCSDLCSSTESKFLFMLGYGRRGDFRQSTGRKVSALSAESINDEIRNLDAIALMLNN